jgi:uncharacterized membrane protein
MQGSAEGGASQHMIALITVIVLVVMVVIGTILLITVGQSESGYDTTVWTNKTSWGSTLMGIGLIGIFSFGVGSVIGKFGGIKSGLKQALKFK